MNADALLAELEARGLRGRWFVSGEIADVAPRVHYQIETLLHRGALVRRPMRRGDPRRAVTRAQFEYRLT